MLESSSSKRKKAGFIRTSSTKALPAFNVTQKSESSNSFSSFQYEKQGEEKNTNQNFNYSEKKQNKSKPTSKPPLPAVRLNQQNFETWGSLEEHNTYQAKREEPTGSLKRNQKLKTNSSIQKWLAQERGKQEIEENLAEAKKICHKIHEMRISNSTEKLKNIEKQFSHHFTTENLQNKQTKKISKNQKKIVNHSKPTHHLLKKLPYEFQESSLSKPSEQEEQSFQIQAQFNKERNKSSIRLKQKVGNHQNSLRNKNQSARNKFIFDNEEEQNNERLSQKEYLITEHNVNDFKHTLKECVIERGAQKKEKSGVFKAKGGICFQLDVNEFHQPTREKQKKFKYQPSKKKKVNAKDQILKRRQMAKNYDKIARMRVFANY